MVVASVHPSCRLDCHHIRRVAMIRRIIADWRYRGLMQSNDRVGADVALSGNAQRL
jgi:hypothetical protein